MLNLVGATRSNSSVLFDTSTVSAGLVYGSVEISTDGLTGALNNVLAFEEVGGPGVPNMDHTNTLLDGIADSAARVTARHRVRVG